MFLLPTVVFYKLIPAQLEQDNSVSPQLSFSEQFAEMTLQEQLITFFMMFAAVMAVEGVDRFANWLASESVETVNVDADVIDEDDVIEINTTDLLVNERMTDYLSSVNSLRYSLRELYVLLNLALENRLHYQQLAIEHQNNSGVSPQAIELTRLFIARELAEIYRRNVALAQNPVVAHQSFFQAPIFQNYEMPEELRFIESAEPDEDNEEKYADASNGVPSLKTPVFSSPAVKSNWVRNAIIIGAVVGVVATIALAVFFPPAALFTAGLLHVSLHSLAGALGVVGVMELVGIVGGALVGGVMGLLSSSLKAAPTVLPVSAAPALDASFNPSYAQLHKSGVNISNTLNNVNSNGRQSFDNGLIKIEVVKEDLDLSNAASHSNHFNTSARR